MLALRCWPIDEEASMETLALVGGLTSGSGNVVGHWVVAVAEGLLGSRL